MKKISIKKIRCVDDRKHRSSKILELKKSLLDPNVGLLQPIGIQPYEDKAGQFEYSVVFGRCRFNILKESGKKTFILGGNSPDLIIREGNGDIMAYAENKEREDLSLAEEIKTLTKLRKKFSTITDLADALNRSASWVAKRINLFNLSLSWKKAIKENKFQYFGLGHFEVVATFDKTVQEEIFEEYTENFSDEKISVKNFENTLYEEFAPVLNKLAWNLDGKVKGCGECPLCKTQESQLFLFEEFTDSGRCMNKKYIEDKRNEYLIATAKDDPSLLLLSQGYHDEENSPFEGSKVKRLYEFNEFNDPEDGQKALIICGNRIGEITYVKKTNAFGESSSSDSNQPKVKRSLEERKEMKHRQRQRRAIDSLIEFVQEEKYEIPSREIIFALLACKGVNSAFYNAWNDLEEGESKIEATIKSFAIVLSMDEAELNKKVWAKLKYKLIEELKFGQTGPVNTNWEEAEIISQIISFDIDKTLEDAITALPDPKSWAKEEAENQEPVKEAA